MNDYTIKLSKTEVEVLREIVNRYNSQFSDLEMQTPDEEKAYKSILDKILHLNEEVTK